VTNANLTRNRWPGCVSSVNCISSNILPRGDYGVTNALSYNATADQIQNELAMISQGGFNLIAFVVVEFVNDSVSRANLSRILSAPVQYAWRVTFTSHLDTYELAEFPLSSYQCNDETVCSPLVSANGTVNQIRGDVQYAAPVVAGPIGRFSVCLLPGNEVLGFFNVTYDSSLVLTSVNSTINVLDWIRLSGEYYQVENITDDADNVLALVTLNRPYMGTIVANDSGLDMLLGIRGYYCKYATSGITLDSQAPAVSVAQFTLTTPSIPSIMDALTWSALGLASEPSGYAVNVGFSFCC